MKPTRKSSISYPEMDFGETVFQSKDKASKPINDICEYSNGDAPLSDVVHGTWSIHRYNIIKENKNKIIMLIMLTIWDQYTWCV